MSVIKAIPIQLYSPVKLEADGLFMTIRGSVDKTTKNKN